MRPAHLDQFSEEYWRNLNELIHAPEATAMGAYCMGAVSSLLSSRGAEPDRPMLLLASRCATVAQAMAVLDHWLEAQGLPLRVEKEP